MLSALLKKKTFHFFAALAGDTGLMRCMLNTHVKSEYKNKTAVDVKHLFIYIILWLFTNNTCMSLQLTKAHGAYRKSSHEYSLKTYSVILCQFCWSMLSKIKSNETVSILVTTCMKMGQCLFDGTFRILNFLFLIRFIY